MTLVRLEHGQPYPWDESKAGSRDPKEQRDYLKTLVKKLKDIYGRTVTAVNAVVDEAGRLTTLSTGTMTGHETFTRATGRILERDPGASPRNLDPSGSFQAGDEVVVINTATGAVSITFDSGGLAAVVGQNQRGIFVYNGSVWRKVFVG